MSVWGIVAVFREKNASEENIAWQIKANFAYVIIRSSMQVV
jgi:hypothetical protein